MSGAETADVRDDAVALLSAMTGSTPIGLWSAPGRVNLIGEHTDYNDGFVFPFAIDRRTVVAVGARDDGVLRVASGQSDEAVEAPLASLDALVAAGGLRGWGAYILGVAWALGQAGADLHAVPGLDLAIDSTVPFGSGLSSSAALESAVAVALNDLWRLGLTREQLVRVGQSAENDVVGAPTGILDQSASLLAQRDAGVFLDCRTQRAQVIDLGFAAAGLAVLVMDTNVEHAHASGGYRERRASCEEGARILGVPALRDLTADDLPRAQRLLDPVTFRRVRHVVTEDQRVLDLVATLEAEGPTAIGAILDASHASLRDDFEVSVPELDLAVETAQQNGAIGARMTGGGFGGSAIALVPREDVPRVQNAVEAAFAEHGFGIPECFTVTPSEGATREEWV